jgi:hypothetical protein
MIIIGVDYHPSDQYIALVDTETGEYEERQLNHSEGEAEKFYRELATRGVSAVMKSNEVLLQTPDRPLWPRM